MIFAAVATSEIALLFAGAGLVLYIASRSAADALTSPANPSPGRLALAHWTPIAITALTATLAGRSEVGIGLAFASSVAVLGLVLGVLVCVAPDHELSTAQRVRSAAWPMLVPAATLALLAGFRGSLNGIHALMLLGLGVMVVIVWHSPEDTPGQSLLFTERSRAGGVYTVMQFLLAVLLSVAGGWIAYKATVAADDQTRVATSGLIALAVLSPLLVLPMLGTGATAGQHGHFNAALGSVVGVTLLNLCLLVPLIVLAHYGRQLTVTWPGGERTWEAIRSTLTPVPYPLAVWRVDTVLLIVLGLLLIPVSLGRWRLQRVEGLGLTFVYAAYLIASTILAMRL